MFTEEYALVVKLVGSYHLRIGRLASMKNGEYLRRGERIYDSLLENKDLITNFPYGENFFPVFWIFAIF